MGWQKYLLAGVACAGLAIPARAHFLFVKITPPAEGGRAVEVFFSDKAEAGDPDFVGKIAHTRLWVQTKPGLFEPLTVVKGSDRLRALLPAVPSLGVTGVCEYGVLARKTPFLLRHFPRAIAGRPADINALKPFDKVPLEITARITPKGLDLSVLHEGKVVPNAVLNLAGLGPKEVAIKTGSDGTVTWMPPGPGTYSLYVSHVTRKAGEWKGKKYQEIRDFATLSVTWPLIRTGPDPAAVALFQEAIATRAQWRDFPGFHAHLEGKLAGRKFSGEVTIGTGGGVEVKVSGNDAGLAWVQEQLESIVLHRLARKSSGEKKQPVLYFADMEKDHPLGRLLIFEGGRFASSYRIKDKQITVVNRHLGDENMTIIVLENQRNKEGHFLPGSYIVQYWNAKTGRLARTESFQDVWQRHGNWDLPVSHVVTVAGESGLSVRSFSLSKHQILAGSKE